MVTEIGRRPAIDAASLAVFRILFGLLMAVSTVRFMALGWVGEFYVVPTFHFTWDLVPWVAPLPAPLMYGLFSAIVVLALAVAAGFHHRLRMALFFAGFTYVELIDKTTYLNHYYLASLLSGLLVFLPADAVWSVDAWRRPGAYSPTISSWTVDLLRFQIGVVYDLAIVIFLLWRPTRPVAYATVVLFHVMTALLFPIGMFPWIMIAVTTIFFPPDWPRRFIGGRGTSQAHPLQPIGQATSMAMSIRTAAFIAVYVVIQVALPLRAYWPGADPEWTCRGFNFAWRVMLVEKAGHTELVAADRGTGRQWPIRTRDYVTERQEKMMAQDPFMIRALARHVADDLRARGAGDVEVRADSFAALNGHPLQRLIDPAVDLSAAVPPLGSSRVRLGFDLDRTSRHVSAEVL